MEALISFLTEVTSSASTASASTVSSANAAAVAANLAAMEQQRFSWNHFREAWRRANLKFIFVLRLEEEYEQEYVQQFFRYTIDTIMSSTQLSHQVWALYTLFMLYNTQPRIQHARLTPTAASATITTTTTTTTSSSTSTSSSSSTSTSSSSSSSSTTTPSIAIADTISNPKKHPWYYLQKIAIPQELWGFFVEFDQKLLHHPDGKSARSILHKLMEQQAFEFTYVYRHYTAPEWTVFTNTRYAQIMSKPPLAQPRVNATEIAAATVGAHIVFPVPAFKDVAASYSNLYNSFDLPVSEQLSRSYADLMSRVAPTSTPSAIASASSELQAMEDKFAAHSHWLQNQSKLTRSFLDDHDDGLAILPADASVDAAEVDKTRVDHGFLSTWDSMQTAYKSIRSASKRHKSKLGNDDDDDSDDDDSDEDEDDDDLLPDVEMNGEDEDEDAMDTTGNATTRRRRTRGGSSAASSASRRAPRSRSQGEEVFSVAVSSTATAVSVTADSAADSAAAPTTRKIVRKRKTDAETVATNESVAVDNVSSVPSIRAKRSRKRGDADAVQSLLSVPMESIDTPL